MTILVGILLISASAKIKPPSTALMIALVGSILVIAGVYQ